MTNRDYKLVWIMAGESSGDLYGAHVAAELKKMDPTVRVAGMGGAEMKKAGVDIMVDSSELGVVGLIEVLSNIFTFIRILLYFIREAKEQRPDVVVMVDYPGFNIRFAKKLWKMGIPVIWYISPQVWAWKKSNIPKLAKYCRKLMVIFPFEPEVWKDSGLDTEFVGHPLVEIVQERADLAIRRDPNRVLLLPGSRKSETSRLMYPFLRTAAVLKERRPELKFAISAPREKVYHDIIAMRDRFVRKYPEVKLPDIDITYGDTARWMQEASAGLAATGTVTVESAIAGLPLVVTYRLNWITFTLALFVIRKLYRDSFTMVNIILNRKAFEEFLQKIITEKVADAIERILPGGSRRAQAEADMREMVEILSCGSEKPSRRAANVILRQIGE